MKNHILLIAVLTATIGCSSNADEKASIRVVLASEVKYEALNPARGTMSPQAGTLWGDRNAPVATGFLAKFKDGFSSPAHIHNATYRAVVISGTIFNGDPKAAPMWMSPGSFWTQPSGGAHITSARGKVNIALVEIDKGPYLVKPTADAFDTGERAVNIDASNIVWVPLSKNGGNKAHADIAYLWGELKAGRPRGVFVKLQKGFAGRIKATGTTINAVIIKGSLEHHSRRGVTLEKGSYFGLTGDQSTHDISVKDDVVIYIRTNGSLSIVND